jgi:hypothetical protein
VTELVFAIIDIRNPDIPQPTITYGEFPFELVYEVDGERVVLKDTYICEYGGVGWNLGLGHFREWTGYLKSNGEEDVVLVQDGTKQVICTIGSPAYYMGDDDRTYLTYPYTPQLMAVDLDSGAWLEEEMEHYKITLIGWKLSEPIENSFVQQ